MLFSQRPLVRNSPSESIVAPIRQEAIRMLEGLSEAGIQTQLTREQVDEALAFYILGEEKWYSLGGGLTADANRIWSGAEAGSQILLNDGRSHLLVKAATYLDRFMATLPVSSRHYCQHARDSSWTTFEDRQTNLVSPWPLVVTAGNWRSGSLSFNRANVSQYGKDTPGNIGFFIPAPSVNDGEVGR